MSHILNPHNHHPLLATVLCTLDFMAAERNTYQRLIVNNQHLSAFEAWNCLEGYRKMAQMLLENMDASDADPQVLRAAHVHYAQLCTIDKPLAKAHRYQQEWVQRLMQHIEDEEQDSAQLD